MAPSGSTCSELSMQPEVQKRKGILHFPVIASVSSDSFYWLSLSQERTGADTECNGHGGLGPQEEEECRIQLEKLKWQLQVLPTLASEGLGRYKKSGWGGPSRSHCPGRGTKASERVWAIKHMNKAGEKQRSEGHLDRMLKTVGKGRKDCKG